MQGSGYSMARNVFFLALTTMKAALSDPRSFNLPMFTHTLTPPTVQERNRCEHASRGTAHQSIERKAGDRRSSAPALLTRTARTCHCPPRLQLQCYEPLA